LSKTTPRWRPLLEWLVFPTSAAILGVSALDARLWLLAWVGTAGVGYALARTHRVIAAVAGLVVTSIVTHAIWFCWCLSMARALDPIDRSRDITVVFGVLLLTSAPIAVTSSLGCLATRRRLPACVWFPIAWVIGERLQDAWSGLSSDWLLTQIEVAPAMRALGHAGTYVTTIACLFVATSIGEIVAKRRFRALWLPATLVCISLVLPPLDPHLERIEGIAAIHLRSEDERPPVDEAIDAAKEPIDLVVWPETILSTRPPVREREQPRASLDAPLAGPRTWHIVGIETLLPSARQNSAVVVDPEGNITDMRAKRALFPVFEREMLGVGRDVFVRGEAPPVLTAVGHKLIALVCGEMLTRSLVKEGRAAGGDVIAVLARDRYQAGRPLTQALVLTLLRLRAIELGVPAVYSSLEGRAALLGADGSVLARSEQGAESGLLTWSRRDGARDVRPPAHPRVAVLYSNRSPQLRTDCPPGRCAYYAIESMPSEVPSAKTVIVAGHTAPPRFLERSPDEIAALVARFGPELVVVDTCFGAYAPLLKALAPTRALVVAAPSSVAERGFRYEHPFFDDAPVLARASSVRTVPESKLYRGVPDAAELDRVDVESTSMTGDALRPRLRSWSPTLVSMDTAGGQEVLVAADWKKIDHPR